MTRETGILLERDGVVLGETVEEANSVLATEGIRAWPLDLSGLPADVRRFLDQKTLTDAEANRIKAHFLLPRARLLQIIADAGRRPHVPNGGELNTYCVETEIAYPQLHVIDKSQDYSGFFPLHVNVDDNGGGSDEVGHVLSGSDMRYRHRLANGEVVTLSLSCPSPDRGWLFTFDGGVPHGGILDDTAPGTKILVQAIGPARFRRRYVD